MCGTASGSPIQGVRQMPVRFTFALVPLLALAACEGGAEQMRPAMQWRLPRPARHRRAVLRSLRGPILDGVTQSPEHSSLLAALKAAGLDRVLIGAGPYTVFAPANSAFAKLPPGTAESLMRSESKAQLTELLASHVVPGVVTAADLRSAMQRKGGKTELATVGGAKLTVSEADGALLVTDAKGGTARVAGAEDHAFQRRRPLGRRRADAALRHSQPTVTPDLIRGHVLFAWPEKVDAGSSPA
jgi:uncharacterized surface protein with fasciclin (FAS1) repeats